MAALLTYNFLWLDTGGMRLALHGEDAQLVMMFEVFGEAPDVAELSRVLSEFRAACNDWRLAWTDVPQTNQLEVPERIDVSRLV